MHHYSLSLGPMPETKLINKDMENEVVDAEAARREEKNEKKEKTPK